MHKGRIERKRRIPDGVCRVYVESVLHNYAKPRAFYALNPRKVCIIFCIILASYRTA